ncbi:succinate dehydrogenase, hydrophobic membrane anchor protein [Terricaulis sp.]|uniref:succinate dehydrogenase, hydrophobic membrane anchor protein n=1 Tax=Terricaulis sp. TaxID=2768686 RepID=UPI00378439F5
MSAPERSMRTPLGRVRHNGAGREGTRHFIAMRVTSIALTFLAVWFTAAAVLAMRDTGYDSALAFIANPVNAVVAALLLVVGFYHMIIGMQEVILDYIGKPAMRIILLLLNSLIPMALAAAALYALLRLNFGV